VRSDSCYAFISIDCEKAPECMSDVGSDVSSAIVFESPRGKKSLREPF
jgi:hypothetical protein